jgi:hypothetical protein
MVRARAGRFGLGLILLSVFVADDHGQLVAAASMDGAPPDSGLNAQRKAYLRRCRKISAVGVGAGGRCGPTAEQPALEKLLDAEVKRTLDLFISARGASRSCPGSSPRRPAS